MFCIQHIEPFLNTYSECKVLLDKDMLWSGTGCLFYHGPILSGLEKF